MNSLGHPSNIVRDTCHPQNKMLMKYVHIRRVRKECGKSISMLFAKSSTANEKEIDKDEYILSYEI